MLIFCKLAAVTDGKLDILLVCTPYRRPTGSSKHRIFAHMVAWGQHIKDLKEHRAKLPRSAFV